jgi:hypothetical protein
LTLAPTPLSLLSVLCPCLSLYSINLQRAIDLEIEPVAGIESNRPRHKEEDQRKGRHVTEVDERRQETTDVQLHEIIPHRVEESVASTGPCSQERSPPPAVVFSTEMKVTEEDRDLGTGDDQDDHDKEQKPEDIINLMKPKS